MKGETESVALCKEKDGFQTSLRALAFNPSSKKYAKHEHLHSKFCSLYAASLNKSCWGGTNDKADVHVQYRSDHYRKVS